MRGWQEVEDWLCWRLELLGGEDNLCVEVGPYYVQAARTPGVLRVEVVSNTFLEGEARFAPGQELRLLELGFAPPGPSDYDVNFWALLDESGARAGAHMLTRALREVCGVHPGQVH